MPRHSWELRLTILNTGHLSSTVFPVHANAHCWSRLPLHPHWMIEAPKFVEDASTPTQWSSYTLWSSAYGAVGSLLLHNWLDAPVRIHWWIFSPLSVCGPSRSRYMPELTLI